MAKPKVIVKCVADSYSAANEKIVEFSNGIRSAETLKGGLIALRNLPDGTLLVNVYRLDPGVEVRVSQNTETPPSAEGEN